MELLFSFIFWSWDFFKLIIIIIKFGLEKIQNNLNVRNTIFGF
jgi:hypothetical protein